MEKYFSWHSISVIFIGKMQSMKLHWIENETFDLLFIFILRPWIFANQVSVLVSSQFHFDLERSHSIDCDGGSNGTIFEQSFPYRTLNNHIFCVADVSRPNGILLRFLWASVFSDLIGNCRKYWIKRSIRVCNIRFQLEMELRGEWYSILTCLAVLRFLYDWHRSGNGSIVQVVSLVSNRSRDWCGKSIDGPNILWHLHRWSSFGDGTEA